MNWRETMLMVILEAFKIGMIVWAVILYHPPLPEWAGENAYMMACVFYIFGISIQIAILVAVWDEHGRKL
jgi:hypothetical protein